MTQSPLQTMDPNDPTAGLLAFLDRVEALPDVVARRFRSYERLAPRAGDTIADIGCGAGTAVREIAAKHALPSGSVVGVDINEPLVNVARKRAEQANVDVTFHVGDALALPCAASSIHGYRAERLYQHVREPDKLLSEAMRVLAPGGRIVIVDQDWDAVLIDGYDRAVTRSIQRAHSDCIANSAVGRQYRRLLLDAGFSDVNVEADVVVSTSYEEYGFVCELAAPVADAFGVTGAQAWLEEQRERGRTGKFFLTMTYLMASARKPGASS